MDDVTKAHDGKASKMRNARCSGGFEFSDQQTLCNTETSPKKIPPSYKKRETMVTNKAMHLEHFVDVKHPSNFNIRISVN